MRLSISLPYLTLACLSVPMTVHGQSSPVMVDISPCLSITDNQAKFGCYAELEARVRAEMDSNVSNPATVAPTVTAETPAQVPPAVAESPGRAAPAAEAEPEVADTSEPSPAVEEFGRQTPVQAARVQASEEGEEELRDTIASLQEREPGRWLFTLAGGQVWYQVNSQRMNFRKGDEIRIYPSPIGSSWRMGRASGAEVGFIQVARVR